MLAHVTGCKIRISCSVFSAHSLASLVSDYSKKRMSKLHVLLDIYENIALFWTFIHRIAENIYSKNSCDVSNQMEKWELISIKNHEFSNLRVQSDVWFSEISTLIELPHFSVSALSIFWQVLIITLLIGRYNPKNMEIMLIIIIVLKLFLRFLRRKCIQMSRYEKFVSCKH